VARPTYEIVGDVEQFDERDTVFAREALVPGTREEILYHESNPDLREIDQRLSSFIVDKLDRSAPTWGRAYYQTVFGSLAHLALPDCVDGRPSPARLRVPPSRAAQMVKSLVLYLGADVVGIGPLRREWVYSHRGARPFFRAEDPNP
jgi:hypothetical protein